MTVWEKPELPVPEVLRQRKKQCPSPEELIQPKKKAYQVGSLQESVRLPLWGVPFSV
jgi:hypothetical protein